MAGTVAEVVVSALRASGVRRVYGIPGDSLNGFTDALRHDGTIAWQHDLLIKTALDEASAACTAWRERPSAGTGEALAAALDHLNTVVKPHLDDEEQRSSRWPR
jgi:glyoxylate carboligase